MLSYRALLNIISSDAEAYKCSSNPRETREIRCAGKFAPVIPLVVKELMYPSSQGTLEKILKAWDFNQASSFNKTYKEAPNPSLRIANFGTIGLPVSERDAAGIKELVSGNGANDVTGGLDLCILTEHL